MGNFKFGSWAWWRLLTFSCLSASSQDQCWETVVPYKWKTTTSVLPCLKLNLVSLILSHLQVPGQMYFEVSGRTALASRGFWIPIQAWILSRGLLLSPLIGICFVLLPTSRVKMFSSLWSSFHFMVYLHRPLFPILTSGSTVQPPSSHPRSANSSSRGCWAVFKF